MTFESLFDALDGIDSLDAQIANAVTSLEAIDRLLPQMITQLKIMTDQTSDDMINVGNDFDQSRSDFFYIPREAFDNEYVKTGMTLTMSPDGKAARFVAPRGERHGPEGIEHVEAFPDAIKSTLTETSLPGSKIYIGGGASNNKDIKEYAASDLLIVAIAAFVPIFLIMLFITRSLMADQAPAAQSARGARKQPSKCPFSMPAVCMNEWATTGPTNRKPLRRSSIASCSDSGLCALPSLHCRSGWRWPGRYCQAISFSDIVVSSRALCTVASILARLRIIVWSFIKMSTSRSVIVATAAGSKSANARRSAPRLLKTTAQDSPFSK